MEAVVDKTRNCHHTAEGQNRFHFARPNGSSCWQENQRHRFEFRAASGLLRESLAFSRRRMEPILSIMTLISAGLIDV